MVLSELEITNINQNINNINNLLSKISFIEIPRCKTNLLRNTKLNKQHKIDYYTVQLDSLNNEFNQLKMELDLLGNQLLDNSFTE